MKIKYPTLGDKLSRKGLGMYTCKVCGQAHIGKKEDFMNMVCVDDRKK